MRANFAAPDVTTTSYPLWTINHATICDLVERGGLVAPNTTLSVLMLWVSFNKKGRIPMDVQASPASLPELDDFLSTFKVRFCRLEAHAPWNAT